MTVVSFLLLLDNCRATRQWAYDARHALQQTRLRRLSVDVRSPTARTGLANEALYAVKIGIPRTSPNIETGPGRDSLSGVTRMYFWRVR